MAVGRLKLAAIAAGVVALGCLAWFGGPALGRRMSFFRVRRVEFVGLRYGLPGAMVAGLRLPPALSVFDDLSRIEHRAAALPGIRRATVGRRFPATLLVELEEIVPVAVTPAADGMRLIDARGRVLPFDPSRSGPDLPVAEAADGAVGELLGRIRELDPALYARVASARRDAQDVVLEIGGPSLRFRRDATAEDMQAVMAVVDTLARLGRTYRELDGRFAGQVIVRGGA